MTDKMRQLIKEFHEERSRKTEQPYRQAKELQSIQNAIRYVAEEEKLLEDAEINSIININDEWWCNE